MNRKKKIVAVVACAALLLAAYLVYPRGRYVYHATPAVRTVHAFIAEEAETQLADQFLVDVPVAGKLVDLPHEVGDVVDAGALLAEIESESIRAQIRGLTALIEQARAQISGVDVQKPKPEALAAARVQVEEARDALDMAHRARTIAEIQLAQAERHYARMQTLYAREVVSQRDYDEARTAFEGLREDAARAEVAENRARKTREIAELNARQLEGSVDDNEFMRDVYYAQIDNLEAQRDVLQEELEKTVVLAPVSGPVLQKFAEEGRMLMPGQPLLEMGDLASAEIMVDVLSEEVGRVEVGDPVVISGQALGGNSLTGRVKKIYPAAFKKISALGIEQQRVRVLVDYPRDEKPLRPGTSVDVEIITSTAEESVAVPERALFEHEGAWHVFRVVTRGFGPFAWHYAKLTPVSVAVKNDKWAALTRGLAEDDRFVAETVNDLEDGARIRLHNPG
ncbi:MAG: HlyD family secretion protein [Candidatus Hydrogenedentota bacterium]